jgi:ribosome-binding protein aMBF1 (putative translation factor)
VQLAKFDQAIEGFDIRQATQQTGSKKLAKAEFEALRSEREVLATQLDEYEALKSGVVNVLSAQSLDELSGILIRARIARGLSQRQLADMLGLKEQQIQRYESEEYASTSLRRLVAISRALALNISEQARL